MLPSLPLANRPTFFQLYMTLGWYPCSLYHDSSVRQFNIYIYLYIKLIILLGPQKGLQSPKVSI